MSRLFPVFRCFEYRLFRTAAEFALSPSGSTWKSLMLQEGAYTMDQEFDGKGLTPYDPAHNSSFLLAGHS
jgi:hypothetical protein